MKEHKQLASQIQQQMEAQKGMITVDTSSSVMPVLMRMQKRGDVELVAEQNEQQTYRWVPMPHPFQRRDVVIWQRSNGTEYRARVVSATRTSVRIVTNKDSMVRNVDPTTLRHAYDFLTNGDVVADLQEPKQIHPLDNVVALWIDRKKKRSCSPRTKRSYLNILSSFRETLQVHNLDLDDDPHKIAQVAQVWAWQRHPFTAHSPQEMASPTTFNQRLTLVSSFYKFALQRGLLHGVNPIDFVQRPAGSIVAAK